MTSATQDDVAEAERPLADNEHRLVYNRPILYPKQHAALFDPHRYSLIEASTKAGKTAGALIWLSEKAFQGKPGQNFWWVAPVSGQADIAFRRGLRGIPRNLQTANLTQKTITLANGAVVWFKSADKPDSLYGEDVYGAVVDEASRTKEEAWYALRSTLTYTRGQVRIIGNVKGRKNWFYQMARKAEASDPEKSDMGYHKIVAGDAVAAGVLAEDEVEDARRNLPEHVFRELYLAEPSDDGGNPFGVQHIAACVGPWSTEPPVVWGWDFAKKRDWTVGVGFDRHAKLSGFHRFQLPWSETMKAVIKATGGRPALCDSTGVGDPIVELLQRDGGVNFEGYIFSSTSKQQLMEGLAVSIQSHEIGFPEGTRDCPLVIELEQFEFEYTRTGVRYSAPEGFHDDCVMALALADIHRHRMTPTIEITPDDLALAQQVPEYMRHRRRTRLT